MFAGITRRPDATSARTTSGARDSRCATNAMASVISPLRAADICVLMVTPYAGIIRIRFRRCVLSRHHAGTRVVPETSLARFPCEAVREALEPVLVGELENGDPTGRFGKSPGGEIVEAI